MYEEANPDTENTSNVAVDNKISHVVVEQTIKQLKHKKSPRRDKILNELLKYGGCSLINKITSVTKKITLTCRTPDNWKMTQ